MTEPPSGRTERRFARHAGGSRRGLAVLLGAASYLGALHANAHPQWNTGVIGGACALGSGSTWFGEAAFCGSAHADILFLRERTRDIGLGPYLNLGTAAFSDTRLSAGLSALVPIAEDFPVVLSLGGLLRNASEPGVAASLFWGVRSYNFHGTYNLAGGVVLSGEHAFHGARANSLGIGLQVDAFLFALPWILIWEGLK